MERYDLIGGRGRLGTMSRVFARGEEISFTLHCGTCFLEFRDAVTGGEWGSWRHSLARLFGSLSGGILV